MHGQSIAADAMLQGCAWQTLSMRIALYAAATLPSLLLQCYVCLSQRERHYIASSHILPAAGLLLRAPTLPRLGNFDRDAPGNIPQMSDTQPSSLPLCRALFEASPR